MQPKKAIQIAIAAMQREYQSLAVHANLCTKYGADYPAALSAVERRKELQEAIEILKEGFQPPLFKSDQPSDWSVPCNRKISP